MKIMRKLQVSKHLGITRHCFCGCSKESIQSHLQGFLQLRRNKPLSQRRWASLAPPRSDSQGLRQGQGASCIALGQRGAALWPHWNAGCLHTLHINASWEQNLAFNWQLENKPEGYIFPFFFYDSKWRTLFWATWVTFLLYPLGRTENQGRQ